MCLKKEEGCVEKGRGKKKEKGRRLEIKIASRYMEQETAEKVRQYEPHMGMSGERHY